MHIFKMIHFIKGNIFESNAQAIINTVNTEGVMGKGIALQFKKAFPANYKAYSKACKTGEVKTGKMFIQKDSNLEMSEKIIINFPTKNSWRKTSEYSYIEEGLDDLVRVIKAQNISSIAIPPLGSGNGGLDWNRVKKMIVEKLNNLNTEIYIYEPTDKIIEYLKTERIKLTDARALLLYVLFDLVRNGEYVSEFSSEKICYFLQRFGAEKYLKLKFEPNFYGPYSGKVRYVLNALNGSYLMGYSDMNKRPFEPILLVSDSYTEIKNHIETNEELFKIATKTIRFLDGFYSDFSLELLSSIDFLSHQNITKDKNIILAQLKDWSSRKSNMFSNERYFEIAFNHIVNYEVV